ncbi:MAG: phosphatidylglycerophosphatase A [Candidatus Omnitrophica bacterium]|nr:phosphatidylglycerophosphatase A [Candidatus Omnitrophota bacterium]MDD5611083.1 phosphatidylglycerophosphatase A [Candidatus Omnitrophota bacterium]
MQKLSRLISTVIYAGYFPVIPGTIASLCGLAIFVLLKNNPLGFFSLTVLILAAGFYSAGRAEQLFNKKDAPQIVIDELAGMLLCFMVLPWGKITLPVAFCIFLLFRIFDWTKPFYIRKLQDLPRSWGIMLDDILAAFYTNILFQVFLRLAS